MGYGERRLGGGGVAAGPVGFVMLPSLLWINDDASACNRALVICFNSWTVSPWGNFALAPFSVAVDVSIAVCEAITSLFTPARAT